MYCNLNSTQSEGKRKESRQLQSNIYNRMLWANNFFRQILAVYLQTSQVLIYVGCNLQTETYISVRLKQ